MRTKKAKQLVSFFFIIAFVLLKVVNLHAFTHAFEQEEQLHDCELCEFYTTNSENSPVTFTPDLPEISIPVLFILEPVRVNYSSPFITISFSGYNFNKPPPTV